MSESKDIQDRFDQLFLAIQGLATKGDMERKFEGMEEKMQTIENKIEKYREKTPQEKLELRTYDSYPFNQKLSDFFDDKKIEMEKTGKKDYVLTSDEVEDINPSDIRNSFQPGEDLV